MANNEKREMEMDTTTAITINLTVNDITLIRKALRNAWNNSFLSPDVDGWKELYGLLGEEITDNNG